MILRIAWAAGVVVGCAALVGAEANVKDSGAVGDGQTLDTPAIPEAIDQCSAGGGGTVRVPAGTYLVGTVTCE